VGLAHGLVEAAHLLGLAGAFIIVARLWTRDTLARIVTLGAGVALLAATVAASWESPGWRAFSVPLDSRPRHVIDLDPGGVERLNAAREAYLVLDLELPGGDPSPLELAFDSGLVVPGASLEPCMPTYGLATLRERRDPRQFRQWWRVTWSPSMVRSGQVGLSVRGPHEALLFGSLASSAEPAGQHHGLSFGEWPYASVYKLMHSGEYRLWARRSVSSLARRSTTGQRTLPGELGVFLVILNEDAGRTVWETAPAPAPEVVTAIWAQAGRTARGDLELPHGSLRLDFSRSEPVEGEAGAVRREPTGKFEGWFVIRTRAEVGAPLQLAVRPVQEMSVVPKYFLPELKDGPPVPSEWGELAFVPAVRVLEARRAPHWQVDETF
jgi:hypothetical protein